MLAAYNSSFAIGICLSVDPKDLNFSIKTVTPPVETGGYNTGSSLPTVRMYGSSDLRVISAPRTKFLTLLMDAFSPYPPFRWSGGRLSSAKALRSYGLCCPSSDRDPRFPHQRSTRPLVSRISFPRLHSVMILRSDKK